MSKLKDLTGMRFGRLTVIERAENKGGHVAWKCRCDCGNVCVVQGVLLRRGTTRSCSCLVKEKAAECNSTHRLSGTKIYNIWRGIKKRCLNSKDKDYIRYGGRGVTVYPVWIDDFQAFYDYVSKLDHFGEEGYTLDRINNNGNYEPNNLRWATAKEQSHNRRNNINIKYEGNSMPLTEFARKMGVSIDTLFKRFRCGDKLDELLRPAKAKIRGAKLSKNDVVKIREMYSSGNYTQSELGKIFGVSQTHIGRIVNMKHWEDT